MASVEDSPANDLSKKRAAARQISKDDDPDAEEEAPVEGATFKKAPDAVLNNRRIVKIRRTGGTAAPAQANPFASIRLVPPPAELKPDAAPDAEEDKSKDSSVAEDLQQPVSEPGTELVSEAVPEPVSETGTKDEVADSAPATEVSADGVSNGGKAVVDGAIEKAAVGPSGLSSETFQQLSSAKNAFSASFGTGFLAASTAAGSTPVASSTGFGSGGFSFGSAPAFGSSLIGSGSGAAAAAASPFGSSVFGAPNGSSSTFQLFGSGAAAAPAAPPASSGPPSTGITPLQEVHVESGEEKEKTVFAADASLFEFLDGGWNERGKGEVKVNVPEDTSRRPRLVMRGKGNLRLLLNANILPNMKITKMDNRGVTFVCANAIGDGKVGLATFALKLRDAQFARDFLSTVEAKKGKSAEPPTPETSPKAPVDRPTSEEAAPASDEAVKQDHVEAAAT